MDELKEEYEEVREDHYDNLRVSAAHVQGLVRGEGERDRDREGEREERREGEREGRESEHLDLFF